MEISKRPNFSEYEPRIYKMWEKAGCFTPKTDLKKKPFTILLPLPNANDPIHIGHVMFVIEDILVRYHRMKGEPALWLPGADHAGIETQYVYEKKLAKKGKSRFDFDRETLYQMIYEFVEENRIVNRDQLKKLGFSLDWSRYHYSLEPEILKTVNETFRKLHKDGLIYRSEKIVNFCTHCGTAFSDLEVNHIEQQGFLYYLNYGPINIATTRPETIFADVAVAVNPKDKRYQKLIGKKATLPILGKELPIIADELVDIEFGTGALKITPGHDVTDFEIGEKHNLEIIKVIDVEGRMINVAQKYLGMSVNKARETVLADLEKKGKLVKKEPLRHTVGICYRCGQAIEPMLMPQWFVKIAPLAKPAIEVVKKGKLKIVPGRFKKLYLQWMENIKDWNVSRQIVWGPKIPAWYCMNCNPNIVIDFIDKKGKKVSGQYGKLKNKYDFLETKKGLQQLTAPKDSTYSLDNKPCKKCGGKYILQETDTFDTWFLSGQWPLTTLGFPDSPDFKDFYPTSVLDTMWDILFFWVARMVMFGLYRTGEIPFEVAHMHCRVVDEKGQKMSKSKNNVVDPMEVLGEYGADALRMALVFGAAPGSDIALGDDKIRAMRNFVTKIWNIGRFVLTELEKTGCKKYEDLPSYSKSLQGLTKQDKKIVNDLNQLIRKTTNLLEQYRFDLAAEGLYHFIWHRFADEYIEYSKERIQQGDIVILSVLRHVYLNCLKLLHPFMPFVTEEIWQKFPRKYEDTIIISKWPESI